LTSNDIESLTDFVCACSYIIYSVCTTVGNNFKSPHLQKYKFLYVHTFHIILWIEFHENWYMSWPTEQLPALQEGLLLHRHSTDNEYSWLTSEESHFVSNVRWIHD
jgi:hypothetical protein